MNSGFRKVRPLYGGLDAWIAAGYAVDVFPLAASEQPIAYKSMA
jgi:3-mercaptopyruvate sulfurtransferase SseA